MNKGPRAGAKLKAKFLESLPALDNLLQSVSSKVEETGHLIGLDGRKLPIRSPHAALNTLLQSAGAVVMKEAVRLTHEILKAHTGEYHQALFVHDEVQLECVPEIADVVGQAMVDAIKQAGSRWLPNCPLDGEYKVGLNWAETH